MANPLISSPSNHPVIWVVAACFNEEAVICQFIKELTDLSVVSRLVLVDDGSGDCTVEKIREMQTKLMNSKDGKSITLLELTRNFGKESAMLAGLDHAKDLLDPSHLPDLLHMQDPKAPLMEKRFQDA